MRTALDIDARESAHQLRGRHGRRQDGRRLAEGLTGGRQCAGAAPIAEDPIVTHAHPATGQGMQQEAPDKLPRRQCHALHPVAMTIVSPAKRHLALVHRHQAMVADGHPMGIAAQVRDHLLGRGKRRLGIDDPGVLLQRSDEAGKNLGVGQGSRGTREAQDILSVGPLEAREILAAQDLGQAFDWEEEVAALRGNPALAVWDQGATSDDPVDVDVVLERLPPGKYLGKSNLVF